MNRTNLKSYKSVKQSTVLVFLLLCSVVAWSQQTPQDSIKTGFNKGNLKVPNPNSIESKYTYDPLTDRYIYTEKVGSFNIKYPVILTPKEYYNLVARENIKAYYKEKIDAFDGKKGDEEAQKNLLPQFYVRSGLFESIFGGNTIDVIPQGSVEMDLGILFSRQDNPAFSPRNRSNFTFDFDQRINLSLQGKVGTRLQINANYDTQASFDFQNLIKLDFDPTLGGGEDSIIQKIEVGNVSMPLNSSLITGAQSLFGVKTQLQFGRTTITGVFSEQRSQGNTVVAQGGGTVEEFELFIRDYDENRHFFLSQYFKNTYDNSLKNYPFIDNKGLQITRIEVWITNRSNRTDNVRNIVAVQDLAETENIGSNVNIFGAPGALPDNENNAFNPTNIGGAGSQLTESIRDIATAQSGFLVTGVNEGFDYAKLENARKLTEQEYTLNSQLGYISLNQRLNNDEVLAVAFQYRVGNDVHQVGEFANDGVAATDVDATSGAVTNQSLVLKLLKSSITNVGQPVWDLMMKNIYDTSAYNLSPEDFTLNIFYNEASPLNYIEPVGGSFDLDINGNPVTGSTPEDDLIENVPLLRVFNLDKLNFNNDPQRTGDGFFDFYPGITVIPENGKIIFTSAEPFGEYLFNVLGGGNYDNEASYNDNQQKYVYDILYKETKTAALEEVEKNKFKLKGRYKSSGNDGIPLGAFNVPRGSVRVTAGGRVLVEGIDYTVNYQLGRVQILDGSLKASNTPIQVSTENNAVFGQQTRRFTGLNIEHKFNDDFVLGATLLNLNERPITQKANYGTEPINNTIFGLNGNFASKVPFLTRLANKLPNIDTDAESNFSIRGEFAYLAPGAPKGTNLNGEATSYIDDFEGTQNAIDLRSQQSWFLSSRPNDLDGDGVEDNRSLITAGIENGYDRALLNWYSIDPIFYSTRRPSGISDNDMSSLYTSRVFINELFPERQLVQGQNSVLFTLDLAYYPQERGPYNFAPSAADGIDATEANDSWAGITRQLTSTDFEQQNVEYIEFWLQDPFQENPAHSGGKLVFNLGNISEDIIKDGEKLYENGLPNDGDTTILEQDPTSWGTIVPQNQSLIYAFDTTGEERRNQDVGYDGYDDEAETRIFGNAFGDDPSNDNYSYFLDTDGGIFERYKKYNGVEGNTPDTFSDTERAANTQPDVEDINRDNTMNTIDSYFEYELNITRASLPAVASLDEIPDSNDFKKYLVDVKVEPRSLPNGSSENVRWYQVRIPIESSFDPNDDHLQYREWNSPDLRSVRFVRMYLKDFTDTTIFRFGTLDLVRSDWRRYTLPLDEETGNAANDEQTEFSVGVIGTIENEGSYVSPPGIRPEELFNNNTVVPQNEQSLVMNVCNLETEDSRGAFKNISVDMRQFKRLRMFIHAEEAGTGFPDPEGLIGFVRIGNDLNDNYYQIEIPLTKSPLNTLDPEGLWPIENEINIPLEILGRVKAESISNMTLGNEDPTFYDVINGDIQLVTDPFEGYVYEQHRVGIKGNPNFGDVRTLMVGVKNAHDQDVCAQVWFNELRLSDMDNEGGWAAVVSMDTNIADFASISATGRQSTSGFGGIEQGPSERSLEDVKQYDVVTNVQVGQLLPKKWGVQIPFNYAQSEELITPKYDQVYKDLTLESRLEAADTQQEREDIKKRSEDYTKRQSINFIGVRKTRTTDKTPRFYDVENLTLNYSYNKVEHRDFEIENSVNKTVRVGANYAFNFNPIKVEPFKKNDSLFTGKYWKWLKDFNVNLLPSSFTVNTDINRQFNRQKFRNIGLSDDDISVEELFRRNYTFDFQYTINYNLTDALQLNFNAANNNIVRNYFKDNDLIRGEQDETLDVWDGLLDVGDPNRQTQTLGVTYQLPLKKIPTFSFIDATYQYTGTFNWQKGSDLYGDIEKDGQSFDLGNTIQNSSVHDINASLDMNRFYRYIGLVKKPIKRVRSRASAPRPGGAPPGPEKDKKKPKSRIKNQSLTKILNAGVGVLTSIKRMQFRYSENNGTFLPGYIQTPGFVGTLKPSLGFTFGSQSDIRDLAARKGWLTLFPEFNQQYTTKHTKQLDVSASLEPVKDLKIDIIGNRTYNENYSENYRVVAGEYQSLTPNTFGNFNISTVLIKTAFSQSDEVNSATFNEFSANRLEIANRLAEQFYGPGVAFARDADGFPLGFGKTNQKVLLPAFLAAYSGQDVGKVKTSAFRDIPIPNWDLKYSGFMKFKWFKKHFKRFSLTHGYRSSYTINQFNTNLNLNTNPNDDEAPVPGLDYGSQPQEALDQSGNFKNEQLFGGVNLTESFSPLVRIDFEMKNSVKVLAEVAKDRLLSLSFDNNLLTEVQGNEYTLGLGYRIKDLRIRSNLAGPKKRIVSDLNMKADVSVRENKTIIRYLDLENNQVTSGQTIWSLKYSADYAFSKNLTGIFYFDYAFSEYAISTAFPQTTIRSGLTLRYNFGN